MDGSPLGRLPRELRDVIYDLSVLPSKPILLHITEAEDQLLYTGSPSSGLFQTCRVIRVEAFERLFVGSAFFIPHDSVRRAALIQTMLFNATSVSPKSLHIQIDYQGGPRGLKGVPWLRIIPSIESIRDQCALAPPCKVTVTAYLHPYPYSHKKNRSYEKGVDIDLQNLGEA